MNELTTEEKARYYDRAIEKAKDAFNDGTISSNTIAYLQDLFPELKESEDEKIRKEILTAFSCGHDNSDIYGHGITYGQVRAWLERQGKKPAVWSEEDKRNLNWVINVWNRLRRGGDAQTTPSQMECLENFLKSLKDRVQPKQEWSEEDNALIENVCTALGGYALYERKVDNYEHADYLENAAKKLKSLRPQNHWKPSDEQIDALDFAADCIVPAEFCVKRKVLKELLEQLKKLREE